MNFLKMSYTTHFAFHITISLPDWEIFHKTEWQLIVLLCAKNWSFEDKKNDMATRDFKAFSTMISRDVCWFADLTALIVKLILIGFFILRLVVN